MPACRPCRLYRHNSHTHSILVMDMPKSGGAGMNDDGETGGCHIRHLCPAGALQSVELMPAQETVVACGRRAGAHLSSPVAGLLVSDKMSCNYCDTVFTHRLEQVCHTD